MAKKKKDVNDFERSITDYFKEINGFTPLSKEEDMSLWEKYKKENDIKARDKIIKSNLKFVASVAKQYIGMGLSYSDLIAEGNMGLMKAMDKFDYNKGYKTISYSVWWIRQSILEAIKKRNTMSGDDLPENKLFEDDEFSDIEDYDDSSYENDEYVEEYDMDKYFGPEEKKLVSLLIPCLSEKESLIITDYYGLDDSEELTLEEIGKKLKLTKERVRQIKETALKKLRSEALSQSISSENYR